MEQLSYILFPFVLISMNDEYVNVYRFSVI